MSSKSKPLCETRGQKCREWTGLFLVGTAGRSFLFSPPRPELLPLPQSEANPVPSLDIAGADPECRSRRALLALPSVA